MGWKQRGGRSYFYRSTRRGGRVVTEYCGPRSPAEFAAIRAESRRGSQTHTAEVWRVERGALEAGSRETAGLCRLIEIVMRLALAAAGYNQHKRSEWRRSQVSREKRTALPPAHESTDEEPTSPEIDAVLRRAKKGDEGVRLEMLELFERAPETMMQICGGHMAAEVERSALDRMAHGDITRRHALTEKMRKLREELSENARTPIERMLVGRVVLCWLDCHDWEWSHNLARLAPDGLSLQLLVYFERMRDRAHRRDVHALKSLAQVQTLVPAIQINLAQNQVNMARGAQLREPRESFE